MSHVRDILSCKGSKIFSVSPNDNVLLTLKMMAEKNIGAILVIEGDKLAGIFSERDFARYAAKGSIHPEKMLVRELMTSKVTSIAPSATTDECMALMATRRIRHLPVIEGGKLIGVISIGDVVNRIIEDHKFSITQLERYVTGEV